MIGGDSSGTIGKAASQASIPPIMGSIKAEDSNGIQANTASHKK